MQTICITNCSFIVDTSHISGNFLLFVERDQLGGIA